MKPTVRSDSGERRARSPKAGSLFVLILAALFLLLAAAGTAHAEHPYTVSGTVSAVAGPQAGVLVSACRSGETSAVAQYMTTALGTYSLSLDAGTYDVVAAPGVGSGLEQKVAYGVVVDSDRTLDFALGSAGDLHISGHLTLPDGTPLDGAEVSIYVPDTGGTPVYQTVDADGRFSIPVTPDRYGVLVFWKGRMLDSPVIDVVSDVTLEIVFPARRVVVHVTDEHGPVAGVGVGALGGGGWFTLGGLSEWWAENQLAPEASLTDTAGDAVLWMLPTDARPEAPQQSYTLLVAPSTPVSSHTLTHVHGVQVTGDCTVQLTLAAGVTLSGNCVSPDGAPFVGAQVLVRAADQDSRVVLTTGEDGRFSIPVPPGTYHLYVTRNGLHLYSNDVAVAADTDVRLTLSVSHVIVHVTDEDGPVEGADVRDARAITKVALTNAVGEASLWMLPGSCTIWVTPPAGDAAHETTRVDAVAADGEQIVEVALQRAGTTPAGNLTGRISFPDGSPLVGALVRVSAYSPGSPCLLDTTGADGSFSFTVSPGSYTLTAEKTDWYGPQPNSVKLESPVIQVTDKTDLDLTFPAKRVAVRVTDERGPMPGVGVGAGGGYGNELTLGGIYGWRAFVQWQPQATLTDAAGEAVLWLLPSDSFHTHPTPSPPQLYPITLAPPAGSGSSAFLYIHDVEVTSDMTVDVHTGFTPAGSEVMVTPITGVTLTYPTVTAPGLTGVTMSGESPAAEPPPGSVYGDTYYGISTSAKYENWLTVSVAYDDAGMTPAQERDLKLWHYDEELSPPAWVDSTWRVDTKENIVYGKVPHLSWFAVGEPPTHTISASAGAGGAVAPIGEVSVPDGSDQSFSITPDPGYQVNDVQVDGASVGALSTYLFPAVDAAHTITATFKPAPLTLAAPAAPAVLKGTEQRATWTVPAPGVASGSFALWLKSVATGVFTRVTPAASQVSAVAGRISYETTWTASQALGTYRLWLYQYASNGTTVVAKAEAPADLALVAPVPAGPVGPVERGSTHAVTFTVPPPGASSGFFRLYLKNVATNALTQVTPTAGPIGAVPGRTSYETTWTASQAPADYRLQVNHYSAVGALLSSGLSAGAVTVLPYPAPAEVAPASATLSRGALQKVTWTVPASVTSGFFRLYLTNAATNALTQVTPTASPISVTAGRTSYETTWSVTQAAASYRLQVNYYAAGATVALSSALSAGAVTVTAPPQPVITGPSGPLLKGSPQSVTWTLPAAAAGGSYGLWLKNAATSALTRLTLASALLPAEPGKTSYSATWNAVQALGSYYLLVYHYAADGVTVLTTQQGAATCELALPAITSPAAGASFVKGSATPVTVTWTLPGTGTATGSFRLFLKNAAGTTYAVTTAANAVKAVPGETTYSAPWSVTQAAGAYTLWVYYYAANGTTLLASAAGPAVTVR